MCVKSLWNYFGHFMEKHKSKRWIDRNLRIMLRKFSNRIQESKEFFELLVHNKLTQVYDLITHLMKQTHAHVHFYLNIENSFP